MKKKLIAMLCCISLAATMLGGCGSEQETETASGDELTIMHFSTSEEAEGNGDSAGLRKMLNEWKQENPDVELSESVLANDDYKTQIATLSAADNLPDVFLLQGMNTKDWAEQGLILDLSEIIKESPDYENYRMDFFTPFMDDDGRIYAIPAQTGGTCTVIIYDKQMWKDAGYDSFPTTWEEIIEANDYFREQGVYTMSFGNGGQWQANSCFLSTVGTLYTGTDWFQSLINKQGAAFTDKEFVDALTFMQETFQSGIFNEDFNVQSNQDVREYFMAGEAAAFIGGNWDVAYIKDTLKAENEEKFHNLGFATLPTPQDAEGATNLQNMGSGYGMAINAKLADDPEKLEAAISLIFKLTGEGFASYVAENYALGGLVQVEEVDLDKFDEVTQDFYNYSYVDTNSCEIYDSYLTTAVWDVCNTSLQVMLNGKMTPEEVAKKIQEKYEEDYLGIR